MGRKIKKISSLQNNLYFSNNTNYNRKGQSNITNSSLFSRGFNDACTGQYNDYVFNEIAYYKSLGYNDNQIKSIFRRFS